MLITAFSEVIALITDYFASFFLNFIPGYVVFMLVLTPAIMIYKILQRGGSFVKKNHY